MNEKIKISLIAGASFGLGAASMAGFLAWTVSSTLKELNDDKHRRPGRYYGKTHRYSSENAK